MTADTWIVLRREEWTDSLSCTAVVLPSIEEDRLLEAGFWAWAFT